MAQVEARKFTRKPFTVEAVRVTEENMAVLARWCRGRIITDKDTGTRFIKVNVFRPLSKRQTMAFAGDHLLFTNGSFKVYTNAAFISSFEQETEEVVIHEVKMPKKIKNVQVHSMNLIPSSEALPGHIVEVVERDPNQLELELDKNEEVDEAERLLAEFSDS